MDKQLYVGAAGTGINYPKKGYGRLLKQATAVIRLLHLSLC